MVDESKKAYEIIKHKAFNAITVDVVRGSANAERAVELRDANLSEEERKAGWGHFLQETSKRPWHTTRRKTVNLKPGWMKS